MRLLFLDDERARHRHVQEATKGSDAQVTCVWDPEEAIKEIERGEFDLIMLDHDLGASRKGKEVSGVHVCQRIVELHPRNAGALFVIHSLNPPGAANMVRCLSRAGFRASHVPYAWLMLERSEEGWKINTAKYRAWKSKVTP